MPAFCGLVRGCKDKCGPACLTAVGATALLAAPAPKHARGARLEAAGRQLGSTHPGHQYPAAAAARSGTDCQTERPAVCVKRERDDHHPTAATTLAPATSLRGSSSTPAQQQYQPQQTAPAAAHGTAAPAAAAARCRPAGCWREPPPRRRCPRRRRRAVMAAAAACKPGREARAWRLQGVRGTWKPCMGAWGTAARCTCQLHSELWGAGQPITCAAPHPL